MAFWRLKFRLGTHRSVTSLLWTTLLAVISAGVDGLVPESCSVDTRWMEVEPSADAFIGAVLRIHRPGQGVYGCGAPSPEGVEVFEALRWAVNVINQDSGLVNGHHVASRFVPGVKLGLKVYDSCGHSVEAVRQMTELFPVLKAGHGACSPHVNDSSSLILGLLDMNESMRNTRIAEAMRDFYVPSVPLTLSSAVPPEHAARIMAEVAHDMEWQRVAILHAEDEYSVHMAKVLGQVAANGRLCISAISSFPQVSAQDSNAPELRAYRKALTSVTAHLPDNTGVLVVGQDESVRRILRVMAENKQEVARLQWLFSWIPDPQSMAELGDSLNTKRFYSLSPYPGVLSPVEDHWARRKDPGASHGTQDHWFLEYVASRKNCRPAGLAGYPAFAKLPACSNLALQETPADVLVRTSRAGPAIHAVFTFAHALRQAWRQKCGGLAGVCGALRQMTRREFVEGFLEPLEFEHLPQERSPPEMTGRKTASSPAGEVEGLKVALTLFSHEQGLGVSYKQVVAYDNQQAEVLSSEFEYLPSSCDGNNCGHCLKVREGRLDSKDSNSVSGVVKIAGSHDVLIPLLLDIHESGSSPLECGPTIRQEAIQELEAALWTLDHIESEGSLPGVHLGVAVVDTCSSLLKTNQRLSSFLAGEGEGSDVIDIEDTAVFVTSSSPDDSAAAITLLKPLNITTISAGQPLPRLFTLGVEHFAYQIALPPEVRAEAAVELLKHLGWSFASLVHGDDVDSVRGAQALRETAKGSGICLAVDQSLGVSTASDARLDAIIAALKDARDHGALAVLVWANEQDTRRFLSAVSRATASRQVRFGEFIWLALGKWAEDPEVTRGFEKETAGGLVFRPRQPEVKDFMTYFRRLRPESNERNPWFREFWEQQRRSQTCQGPDCGTSTVSPSADHPLDYISSASTGNIMQAVLVVASAVARLRSEMCGNERGLCTHLLKQSNLRQLLNHYVQYSAALRPDDKTDVFSFSSKGFGDVPVEILNFRRQAGSGFSYQKVGSYRGGLTNFVNSVAYDTNGEEVALGSLQSECLAECAPCGSRTTDFLIIDSPERLFLAATFGVHTASSNPLFCGPLGDPSGLQNVEAFLWALDQVNADPKILPGIRLGAVVFDTCSSREKTSRDVSNFLSQSLKSLENDVTIPTYDRVAGFVAGQSDDIVQPVADVTMPLNITTLAPQATSTDFSDVLRYPYLLRMSLPSNVIADALVALLKQFRWSYVSVVCAHKDRHFADMFRALVPRVEARGVRLAWLEKVDSDTDMAAVVHHLKIKQQEGASVVLLLVNTDLAARILEAAKRQHDSRRLGLRDLLWISADNVEVFHRYPQLSLGAISVRPAIAPVPMFRQYFQGLSLRNNTRNPWFREYWEQVFKCRGAACFSQLHKDLQQVPFTQGLAVADTINAVWALAHGLDALRRALCLDTIQGICHEMTASPRWREMIFPFVHSLRFSGSTEGSIISFTDFNHAAGSLDVLNFRQVGSSTHAFVLAGRYNGEEGLIMNMSQVRVYDNQGLEIRPEEILSQCRNGAECPSVGEDGTANTPHRLSLASSASTMQILSKQSFALAALLPVHRPDSDFFACGTLNHPGTFQNLVALAFALEEVNSNKMLLPGIQLGTIAFDYCGRKQKAEEKFFGFFSGDSVRASEEGWNIKPNSIVATVTFGDDVAVGVLPILEAKHISQIVHPAPSARTMSLVASGTDSLILRSTPPSIQQLRAIVALLRAFDWRYVHIVYQDDEYGRTSHWEFLKAAKNGGVCVAQTLVLSPESSIKDIGIQLTMLTDPEVRVLVLLVDDALSTKTILQAAKDMQLLQRFVWVATDGWGDSNLVRDTLQNEPVNALTIKTETYEVPEFKKYLAAMTLGKHDPIPDAWFEEFWQHFFQCQLSSSLVPQKQYPDLCSGREKLSAHNIEQDLYVFHTVHAVRGIARTLHGFLQKQCLHGTGAIDLDDCGKEARKKFSQDLRREMAVLQAQDCQECQPSEATIHGFQVLQLQNSSGKYSYIQVGLWKDNGLNLRQDAVTFTSGTAPTSICYEDCPECNVIDTENMAARLGHMAPLDLNFKTVWGIVATALSLLGIVLVIICTLYFLLAFPVTVGTTVLGYMILFGLLLLYAVNFAFVIAPTAATCGVRRFALGLAYSIVFGGMLVKAMNTWRLMGYHGNRMLNDGTRLTSPVGLLVVAIGLVIVQIVLSTAWLVLMPPKIGMYANLWRCAPPGSFESELVVSLVYVMLLLGITVLFSALTWKCGENNRESRWILACCLQVALIWVAWTVLSTRLPYRHRDPAIVAANLLCATLVMLCLYLRKVYLYSKLTRQARDREIKAHLQTNNGAPAAYGSLQKGGVAPVLYGSQASLSNKIYGGISRFAVEKTPSEGGGSDSTGSVQVQAADLYPLEMYDGGSQFQPLGSVYSSKNMLVLDDTVAFAR